MEYAVYYGILGGSVFLIKFFFLSLFLFEALNRRGQNSLASTYAYLEIHFLAGLQAEQQLSNHVLATVTRHGSLSSFAFAKCCSTLGKRAAVCKQAYQHEVYLINLTGFGLRLLYF